jgi:hypothetical protein
MRTKTILLSAVAGVLSSASLMAQVYSLNAVGYINVTVPPGFSIIANQLNTTNNFITPLLDTQLLDGNHNGVTIYKYDSVLGFDDTMIVTGTGPGTADWQGNASTSTLNPGEGAFIFSPFTTNFTLTFVGTVPTGSLTNVIKQNFNLVSSITPQSAGLDTGLGLVPQPGDTVYFYDPVNGYDATYVYGTTSWQRSNGSLPASPTPNVGQGFFYFSPSASGNTWVNNFSVN